MPLSGPTYPEGEPISRAFEQLGGESVREFVEEQYDRGLHRRRKHPRTVKLVGDPQRGRIVLVDAAEANGEVLDGQPGAARLPHRAYQPSANGH